MFPLEKRNRCVPQALIPQMWASSPLGMLEFSIFAALELKRLPLCSATFPDTRNILFTTKGITVSQIFLLDLEDKSC